MAAPGIVIRPDAHPHRTHEISRQQTDDRHAGFAGFAENNGRGVLRERIETTVVALFDIGNSVDAAADQLWGKAGRILALAPRMITEACLKQV